MDCFFCTKADFNKCYTPPFVRCAGGGQGVFFDKKKTVCLLQQTSSMAHPKASKQTALNTRKLEQNREFYKKGRLKKEF